MNQFKKIWTIGHSTHTAEKFIAMLKSFQIEVVADIRSFPGSRRYPHFNKEYLSNFLPQHGTEYIHFPGLGGRRKPRDDSKNNGWRLASFKGYADYMETKSFEAAISELQNLARIKRVAFMCSEAVWWRCHRSLVSDFLKFNGWAVFHIMDTAKAEEHPYTSPARIVNNQLCYSLD